MRTVLLLLLLFAVACGDERPGPAEEAPPAPETERRGEREQMVKLLIEGGGIGDPHVLRAMRRVPRHLFVPEGVRRGAYDDRPLPIGLDQTISAPFIVGSMTEEALLDADSKVLEIGTGSGYQAAVLAEITPHVFTIEIRKSLADKAAQTLKELGYDSVKVRHGDGYHGWQEEAPFDAIIVTAAAAHLPPPLVKQLKPGGRMVIPVGPTFAVQDLVLVEKDDDGKVYTRSLYAVRFVPFIGAIGRDD